MIGYDWDWIKHSPEKLFGSNSEEKKEDDHQKCHLSHQRELEKRVDRYPSIIQTNGTSLPTLAKIHTHTYITGTNARKIRKTQILVHAWRHMRMQILFLIP